MPRSSQLRYKPAHPAPPRRIESDPNAPPTIIRLNNPISQPNRPIRWRTDTAYTRRRPPSRALPRLIIALLMAAIFTFVAFRLPAFFDWLFSDPGLAAPSTVAIRDDFVSYFPVPTPRTKGRVLHQVRASETWQSALTEYGFNKDLAAQFQAELLGSADPAAAKFSLRRGSEIEFFLDENGLSKARSRLEPDKEVVFRLDLSGQFRLKVQKLRQTSLERVLMGEISHGARSFSSAAQEAGVSYDVVDNLVDLFSDKINFRKDFRLGDRFTVVFKEEFVGDELSATPGPILAAALSVNGTRFVAIRYVGSDGEVRYFDEKGHSSDNSFLRYPLKFSRISSEFTYARFHPVLKIKRPHNGVDFAAPTGTPVRTVANGLVTIAGDRGGSGIMVQIKHSDKYETGYLHLSKIAPGVKQGSRVRRGDVIGAVGSTGLATGPHLHFSFLENGKYVNPLKTSLPMIDELGQEQKINATYLARALFTLDRYQGMNFFDLERAR